MTSPPSEQSPSPRKSEHDSLKYHLLGPSLNKAGQDSVDQSKVSEIIYNTSKGTKFFIREEVKDKVLTGKIESILRRKKQLEKLDSLLTRETRAADLLVEQFELSRDLTQHIVHVDCDAFYAAVEQLGRPELRNVPFAVGKGVLTTCNYHARKFGCRSGMAGFVAQKLCPNLVFLPANFQKYNAKAREVRAVLVGYDPRFESASIDEAYLNITDYCAERQMRPEDVVGRMRREIHEKTGITVSAGIAANAKLAKICSNINKPNGQYLLPGDRDVIMSFMAALPPRKVNGIGRVFERELAAIGVSTCADIYDQRRFLRQLFGEKAFEFLIACYLGLGRTHIQPAEEYERKSVGTESTFKDLTGTEKLRDRLRWTAGELEKDMKRAEVRGRTLCLKVKLHTYEVYTRQVVTPRAVWQADDLYQHALPMLSKLEQEYPGMRLRLMGLRCSHLVSTKKPPDTMSFFFGLRMGPGTGTGTGTGTTTTTVMGVKRKLEEMDGWEDYGHLLNQDLNEGVSEVCNDNCDDDYDDDDYSEVAGPANAQRHGREISANPPVRKDVGQERQSVDGEQQQENGGEEGKPKEWWDCPICSRPQAADEKLFNGHVDLCLSRQTIRDAVQAGGGGAVITLEEKEPSARAATATGRKRGNRSRTRGGGSMVDTRQKKLCFG